MTVIPTIIEQHAEEAAFLWLQRDTAVREPHYNHKDLTKLDDRGEAHIDELRIAGDAGWEICKETLVWEEAGEVFTAVVLAFESGNKYYIQTVIDTGSEDLELSRGIISALGWLTYLQARRFIQRFANSESPKFRGV